MVQTNSNGINLDFKFKFDHEGQGQSHSKTIVILTQVFYAFGPNLAILAWMEHELSHGQQVTDTQTDGHTNIMNVFN